MRFHDDDEGIRKTPKQQEISSETVHFRTRDHIINQLRRHTLYACILQNKRIKCLETSQNDLANFR